MSFNNMIPKSLSLNPTYIAESAWWQHVPIAHWLVETIKPKRIVELGTHLGVSFFAFCEAAGAFSPSTFTYAIDTWGGDEHASFYGEEIFARVRNHWESTHKSRSTLIRSDFDTALQYFEDSSIDILHIDGLHTYEAVKHDFETWLPKMNENSLILFHDINVRERGFGVWKLWQELKTNYKTFEVMNGHGLGLLILGDRINNEIDNFSNLSSAFISKGALLERISHLSEEANVNINLIAQAKAENLQTKAEANQAVAELMKIKQSQFWILTRPVRKIFNLLIRQIKGLRRERAKKLNYKES